MVNYVRPEVLEREAAEPGTRLCYSCDKLIPLEDFSRKGDPLKSRECYECRSRRALTFDTAEKIQRMRYAAMSRARRQGLPFDLSVEDIGIPEFCPVLGIKLEYGTRKQRDSSPSLDRIDPAKGYVRGNVIVVSWLANNIRRNFQPEQLRKVADFYELLPGAR